MWAPVISPEWTGQLVKTPAKLPVRRVLLLPHPFIVLLRLLWIRMNLIIVPECTMIYWNIL